MDNYYQDIKVYNWMTHCVIHSLRQVHITLISLNDSFIDIYYIPYGSHKTSCITFEKQYNHLEIS